MKSILSLAAALALASACGSAPKKSSDTTTAAAKPAAADSKQDATTELAEGELRDAILHLHRVHFAYDHASLTEHARTMLAKAAPVLIKHDVAIRVRGHADARGTPEYNIALGERRADAVADYLIALGVPKPRVEVVSFGEEVPLANGETRVDHAANRRVDFRVTRGDVELVVEAGLLLSDEGKPLEGDAFFAGPSDS